MGLPIDVGGTSGQPVNGPIGINQPVRLPPDVGGTAGQPLLPAPLPPQGGVRLPIDVGGTASVGGYSTGINTIGLNLSSLGKFDSLQAAFAQADQQASQLAAGGFLGSGLSKAAIGGAALIAGVGIAAGGANQPTGRDTSINDPLGQAAGTVGNVLGTGVEEIGRFIGITGNTAAPNIGKGTQQAAGGTARVVTSAGGGAAVGGVQGTAAGISDTIKNATGLDPTLLLLAGAVVAVVLVARK